VSLHAGKHVSENLRLVRMLGRGAMGSVWLADHLTLQSQVAVKFMSTAMADDEVSIQRFRQEAKAAAEIRSPHVVQVFDHGTTPDMRPYIVMELLEGESLDKRVRHNGPMSPHGVARIIGHACKALAKAHARGIMHRDLKPGNIFVIDAGGEPFTKVLDFGVAKFSGREAINMTAAGNMVGTPAFMSPEQLFHGKEVDHRGDLWSLCVCAYFSLTGERPFEGKTLGELCVNINRGLFNMPSQMRNDLPPDIDAFFARAFHKDLGERFQTAKDLATALEMACGMQNSMMQSTPSAVASSPYNLQTFPGTSVSHPAAMRPRQPRALWPMLVGAALAVCLSAVGMAIFFGGEAARQSAAAPGAGSTAVGATAAPTSPTPPASADDDGATGRDDGSANGAAAGAASASSADPVAAPSATPKTYPRRKGGSTPHKGTEGDDDRSKRAAKTLGI